MHTYLEPTQATGHALIKRGFEGEFVMLNMLRYRPMADYSAAPELAPIQPISGEAAYQLYMQHTRPFLQQSGGSIVFFGRGGSFLIGPASEHWDAVLLVRQSSLQAFLAFASNIDYLAGIGHRLAALEDSRLLPLEETAYGL
jgi:hypothetical protein